MTEKVMLNQADGEEQFQETKLEATVEPKLTFSIVIPAFNEEHRIMKALREWATFLDVHFNGDYEILVVMDGCTDRTPNIVSSFSKKVNSIVPLIYPQRLGKGRSLRKAIERAKGDVIFFTDADGSLPVGEFCKFAKAIGMSDLAIGSRYWEGSAFEASLPLHRLVLSRAFNALLRTVFKEFKGIYDTQCGAKAVRRSVFNAIKSDLFISGFAFDVNLVYSSLRKGFTVTNICVSWNHCDDYSKVSGNCWKISFAMFLSIFRLRVYYSRFRKLLYSRSLRSLFKPLFRVFP